MQTTRPTALVLGATGGLGGAVTDRLLAEGWQVRVLHRDPARARSKLRRPGLQWFQGDALDADRVAAAADGVDLIVHAVNPPGYRNWRGLQMPMLENTIAAARETGARILFPGNVYNFGPDAFPVVSEDSDQNPISRKGAIRVEMEQALASAADTGVRVLIVRAGDFFGGVAGNNWFAEGLMRGESPTRAISYPGDLGVEHAWAYLPDVAETMVRLASRDDLADFEVFHMRGHQLTGEALVAALERVLGHEVCVRRLPWLALRAASPFSETLREMLEMQYLWDQPVLLDNTRLTERLGAEPKTPIEEALAEAMIDLGLIGEVSRKAA